MPTREIEEFARVLVEQVRDVALRNCDGLRSPNARSPVAQRWRSTGATPSDLNVVLPDAVDEVMFSLLHAIDEGALRLKFATSDGQEVDLTEAGRGELAGWYMGSGGWRPLFSKERFFDDFADM